MSLARYPSLIDKVVFITGGGSGIGGAMVEAFADRRPMWLSSTSPSKRPRIWSRRSALRIRRRFFFVRHRPYRRARNGDGGGQAAHGADRGVHQQRRQRSTPGGGRSERRGLGPHDGAQSQAPILRGPDRPALDAGARRWGDRQFLFDRLDARRASIVGLRDRQSRRYRPDEHLAREFGPDNIRVNAIAPGAVITERQRRLWMGEKEIADFRTRQCISRTLVAEDVARLALFLSSDDSAMITKQCYQVDGGLR